MDAQDSVRSSISIERLAEALPHSVRRELECLSDEGQEDVLFTAQSLFYDIDEAIEVGVLITEPYSYPRAYIADYPTLVYDLIDLYEPVRESDVLGAQPRPALIENQLQASREQQERNAGRAERARGLIFRIYEGIKQKHSPERIPISKVTGFSAEKLIHKIFNDIGSYEDLVKPRNQGVYGALTGILAEPVMVEIINKLLDGTGYEARLTPSTEEAAGDLVIYKVSPQADTDKNSNTKEVSKVIGVIDLKSLSGKVGLPAWIGYKDKGVIFEELAALRANASPRDLRRIHPGILRLPDSARFRFGDQSGSMSRAQATLRRRNWISSRLPGGRESSLRTQLPTTNVKVNTIILCDGLIHSFFSDSERIPDIGDYVQQNLASNDKFKKALRNMAISIESSKGNQDGKSLKERILGMLVPESQEQRLSKLAEYRRNEFAQFLDLLCRRINELE